MVGVIFRCVGILLGFERMGWYGGIIGFSWIRIVVELVGGMYFC